MVYILGVLVIGVNVVVFVGYLLLIRLCCLVDVWVVVVLVVSFVDLVFMLYGGV